MTEQEILIARLTEERNEYRDKFTASEKKVYAASVRLTNLTEECDEINQQSLRYQSDCHKLKKKQGELLVLNAELLDSLDDLMRLGEMMETDMGQDDPVVRKAQKVIDKAHK